MSETSTHPRKRMTAVQRAVAAKRVIDFGEAMHSVATELGVHAQTVSTWVKAERVRRRSAEVVG